MKEIDKELFNKVIHGKTVSELEACISRDADIYATNDEGESIIHIAAKYGRQDFMVKLVREYNVDVDYLDSEGRTPIYHAALCNRSGTVKTLVNKLRADFNIADRSGIAPIHAAILKDITNKNLQDQSKINKLSLDILKFLVEIKGVDVNCITKNGWTPLHCAAKRGCFEIANFLVKRRAAVSKKNASGRNSVHVAATNGHGNIVDLLLDSGVNINDTDLKGYGALYYAAWNGHREVINLLIRRGAVTIDIKKEGSAILYNALDNNYLEVVKFIVEVNKVKVNSIDEKGRTLLFYLVDKGNPKVAELVINEGENVNQLSSLDCEVEIAKYLLSKGANIFAKDNYNRTLYVIAKKIYDEHSKSMLDCSATKSPPCDSQDIADKVFDLKADLGVLTISGANETNRDSQTLSRFSTEESSSAMQIPPCAPSHGCTIKVNDLTAELDDLCISGASGTSSNITGIESVSTLGDSGTQGSNDTLLCDAVKSCKLARVKSLIDKCSDINKTYENGNTLLHFAAGNSKAQAAKQINEMVKLFIKKGADPNSCNSEGNRPLHLAVQRGYSSVVETLLRNNATVDVKNKARERPLDLVKSGPNAKKIKNLLSEYGEKQLKINGVDVKEQRTGLKSDSCLDNVPTSTSLGTSASASCSTSNSNISDEDETISSHFRLDNAFGGARQKQNLGNSQQNVSKVKGLGKDKSVPESSQSSSRDVPRTSVDQPMLEPMNSCRGKEGRGGR